MLLSTVGGISLWSVVVVLPAVQAEFGVDRATASLPYTLTMIGFGVGGVAMGRMADRFGIMLPALIGAVALSLGYVAAANATSLWQFALAHGRADRAARRSGVLRADRRRHLALVHAAARHRGGDRGIGQLSRRRDLAAAGAALRADHRLAADASRHRRGVRGDDDPARAGAAPQAAGQQPATFQCALRRAQASLGMSPATLQVVLAVAGFCCCVAMSMPQVHIVAYCGDLGYGVTRGAEMLSLMLGLGIVSRVGSGFIADRIGGLPTLLLGSVGQMLALLLYLGFSGLALAVCDLRAVRPGAGRHRPELRDRHPRIPAGARGRHAVRRGDHGDAVRHGVRRLDLRRDLRLTGSYGAAFANGALWNLLNAGIAVALLLRRARGRLIPLRSAPPVGADHRAEAALASS